MINSMSFFLDNAPDNTSFPDISVNILSAIFPWGLAHLARCGRVSVHPFGKMSKSTHRHTIMFENLAFMGYWFLTIVQVPGCIRGFWCWVLWILQFPMLKLKTNPSYWTFIEPGFPQSYDFWSKNVNQTMSEHMAKIKFELSLMLMAFWSNSV